MAKRHRANRTAESTSSDVPAGASEGQMETTDNGLVTLTKRNTQKNGIVTYAREGVNASVYFNKSMFNGDAPETVQVAAVNLRAPGEGGVGGGRTVDPAKLAQRAQEAEAKAAKATARAAKATEKAAKLAARVAAAQPTEGDATAAE